MKRSVASTLVIVASIVTTVAHTQQTSENRPTLSDQMNDAISRISPSGDACLDPFGNCGKPTRGIKANDEVTKDERITDDSIAKDLAKDKIQEAAGQVISSVAPTVGTVIGNLPFTEEDALKKAAFFSITGVSSVLGKTLGSSFLEETLPEVLGSNAAGSLGLLLKSDTTALPKQDQIFTAGGVTWDQIRAQAYQQQLFNTQLMLQMSKQSLRDLRNITPIRSPLPTALKLPQGQKNTSCPSGPCVTTDAGTSVH